MKKGLFFIPSCSQSINFMASLHLRMQLGIGAVILLLFAGSALAYRPFTTEDSGVAGKGVLQTEVSYDYFQWKNGDTDQIFLLVAPIYGPTESLELSVETPYVIHITRGRAPQKGVGDINLVAKQVLIWDDYEKKDALL
ncbi:MAG: hypothetical protein HQK89_18445, partial [Nitrospirae bacterium]|nr:hypothetical protein [Nitrospirota bacterium]